MSSNMDQHKVWAVHSGVEVDGDIIAFPSFCRNCRVFVAPNDRALSVKRFCRGDVHILAGPTTAPGCRHRNNVRHPWACVHILNETIALIDEVHNSLQVFAAHPTQEREDGLRGLSERFRGMVEKRYSLHAFPFQQGPRPFKIHGKPTDWPTVVIDTQIFDANDQNHIRLAMAVLRQTKFDMEHILCSGSLYAIVPILSAITGDRFIQYDEDRIFNPHGEADDEAEDGPDSEDA
ncbi:MAG: hypothetical protein M1831_000542 [Alyxoria varia]|nr:MAG: hypothetical protein M1831_000542 [Alyxoria varia]